MIQQTTTDIELCPVCSTPFDSHDNSDSPCIDKILAIVIAELSGSIKSMASREDIALIQETVSRNIAEMCAKLNSTQITNDLVKLRKDKETLETSIKKEIKLWTNRRKLVDSLKKITFEDSDLKFFHVFYEAVAEKRFWRRYIRRRFRFDVTRVRYLRNPPLDFGPIERNVWTYAINRYFIFHARLDKGTKAFAESYLQAQNIEVAYTKAIIAMEIVLYRAFYAIAVAGVASPWREQQSAFLPDLIGYVKAQIKQYPRLKKALSNDRLLDQLPGAVFLALHSRSSEALPPMTGPDSLANAVAKLLETEASRGHDEIGDTAEIQETVAQGFDRFVLQEEARLELTTLIGKAGLSDRETQVLELKLQDYTEEDIASRLGITDGTVKTLWSRTRSKLKEAAKK